MLHKAVEELPDGLKFLPWSEKEMRRTGEVDRRIFVRRSKHVWVLHDYNNRTIMVAGIIQPTLMSTPELWVLLCEPFRQHLRRNLRQLREKFKELLDLYPHVMVRVDGRAPLGQKFVKSFGFTEYHRDQRGELEYIYYEVRK